MKLCTSVHNKVSEQKAGEVLGKVRERKEQKAAALSFAEQLEPPHVHRGVCGTWHVLCSGVFSWSIFSTERKTKHEEQRWC